MNFKISIKEIKQEICLRNSHYAGNFREIHILNICEFIKGNFGKKIELLRSDLIFKTNNSKFIFMAVYRH